LEADVKSPAIAGTRGELNEQEIARRDFLTTRVRSSACERQLPSSTPFAPLHDGRSKTTFPKNRLPNAYLLIPDRTTTSPKNPQVAQQKETFRHFL
jgi:hypothetical protein